MRFSPFSGNFNLLQAINTVITAFLAGLRLLYFARFYFLYSLNIPNHMNKKVLQFFKIFNYNKSFLFEKYLPKSIMGYMRLTEIYSSALKNRAQNTIFCILNPEFIFLTLLPYFLTSIGRPSCILSQNRLTATIAAMKIISVNSYTKVVISL